MSQNYKNIVLDVVKKALDWEFNTKQNYIDLYIPYFEVVKNIVDMINPNLSEPLERLDNIIKPNFYQIEAHTYPFIEFRMFKRSRKLGDRLNYSVELVVTYSEDYGGDIIVELIASICGDMNIGELKTIKPKLKGKKVIYVLEWVEMERLPIVIEDIAKIAKWIC